MRRYQCHSNKMHYSATYSDYSVKIRPCFKWGASETVDTETCGRARQNQRSNSQVFFNFHHTPINLTVSQLSQRASRRQSPYREQCPQPTEFDYLMPTGPEYRYELGATSLNANESSEDENAWDDWCFDPSWNSKSVQTFDYLNYFEPSVRIRELSPPPRFSYW